MKFSDIKHHELWICDYTEIVPLEWLTFDLELKHHNPQIDTIVRINISLLFDENKEPVSAYQGIISFQNGREIDYKEFPLDIAEAFAKLNNIDDIRRYC